MVDGDNNGGAAMANTDYPCDVCGEALARFWHEDKGAVCEGCGRDDSACKASGDDVKSSNDSATDFDWKFG